METVFVVDHLKSKGYYSGHYGYWDLLNQQILIFLFRFDPAEETIIERLCYVIEHEWLHELFARNVPYRYRGIAHYIISMQQSWRDFYILAHAKNAKRK